MLPLPVGREASSGVGAPVYTRHRPERTLLYQLVQEYYPELKAHLSAQGTALPGYVDREFEEYLKCGRLEQGFLRVSCDSCHAEHLVAFSCKRRGFCPSCGGRRMAESAALLVDEVFPEQPVRQWVLSVPYPLRFLFASRPAVMGQVLGIVYRCIATHLIKKAGFSRKTAQTGAVTLIQRFGSALNLNVHFHMLFLDGVYVERPDGTLHFHWVKAPTSAELTRLTQTLARRIGRYLERQGLLERDVENSYLAGDGLEAGPMEQLQGSSITYRIAIGPQQGRKVFTLQTLPACDEPFDDGVGKVAGFSLHAGVAARADQRKKLERLCRYIRNGTTTLFAALNVLDGQVIGQCQQRHTHTEWLRFLKKIDRETPKDKTLHLIADNYATHKHPAVHQWLAKHPRFHMHFTPTSASWLNMVERFFRDITTERLRRGVFTSVPELITAIDEYIAHHNTHPKPFIWTKSARDILQKVIRANSKLSSKQNEALH